MVRKRFPIGVQTFAHIREDDCYYVDKTGYAVELVERGKAYLLSRPRRFGKSLFLDTLAEMFAGNKALFEGLACYDVWDWDTVYPVVRIDFTAGVFRDWAGLEERIQGILAENEKRLGVPQMSGTIGGRFSALLRNAHAKYGQRVVVLVDEYDKPVLDNLGDAELAEAMRRRLMGWYEVIKGADADVEFALLTGVTKQATAGIFSGLNHLHNISIHARYSAICGFTEQEVDTVFAAELEGLDRERIRRWYYGYNWTGEAVYNPWDLLSLLRRRQFEPYWFQTGSPRYLVDTLISRQFYLPQLETLEARNATLSAFDVGDVSTKALLFQTGYLTIGASRQGHTDVWHSLRFPNLEVRMSLAEALLWACSPDRSEAVRHAFRLSDLLEAGDLAGIEEVFRSYFAGIRDDWYRTNPMAQSEGYFASVFYTFFAFVGWDVTAEDTSSPGRLDLAVRVPGQVYLFGVKVTDGTDDDAAEGAGEPQGQALQQLKDRGYADTYRSEQIPVHLVGIEISRRTRNITAFDTETINP